MRARLDAVYLEQLDLGDRMKVWQAKLNRV
jgi:hypothetical protein